MTYKAILAATAALIATHAGAADLPGYDRLSVQANHQAAPIAGTIWYPSASQTYSTMIGANPAFKGVKAMLGSVPAEGSHPLVLISHGSGGNMDNLGWLATGLVQQGAIVAGVNHPGSTSGDSSPRRSIQHWTRAMDATAALDSVLAHPDFGPLIDQSRIYMLGFSFGGFTAMSLAGAQVDLATYTDYCDQPPADAMDCIFFAKGGVKFDQIAAADFNQSLKDDRIAKTVAIDPGLGMAYTSDSLAAIDHPVFFLNLGKTEDLVFPINVGEQGHNLTAKINGATYDQVEGANHFTFLGECTPDAPKLLEAESEDPICTDPEGVDRAKAHDEILTKVSGFLFAN